MALSDFLATLLARQPEAQPTLGFMPQQPPSPPLAPGGIDENIGGPPKPLIPPWLSQPSPGLAIQGVPLVPLLAGIGGAFLNRATASKRYRNQAMGEGFGAGYGLLDLPIERDRAEQKRMREFLIDKGWADPFGLPNGAVGTGTLPPAPVMAGLGVPGVAPTGPISGPFTPVAGPTAAPQKRAMFTYGGMPIFATPPLAKEQYEYDRAAKRYQEASAQNAPTGTDVSKQITIGKGGDTSAQYTQASSDETLERKAKREAAERLSSEYKYAVEQRKMKRDWAVSQGLPAGMSDEQIEKAYNDKQIEDRIAKGEQAMVPGPGTAKRQTIDPNTGRTITSVDTAAPVDVDQKQQEFEQKAAEHGWKKTEFEYKESEKALIRQAAKNRGLDSTAPIALLLTQIEAYETTKRADAARAKITPDPNAAYVEEVDAAGNKTFRKTTPSTLEVQRENAKQDILQKELKLRQQQIDNEVANLNLNRLQVEATNARTQYQGFVTAIDRIQANGLPPGPELKRLEKERDLALYRMDALDKRSRGEPIGPEAETKRPDPDVRKIMDYTDTLGPQMLQSREDFRKIRALPGPPDPLQNKGHQIVIDQMQKILDYYVPRFEAMAAPTWGGFGSKDLTSEQKDAMRAATPGGDFDWAYHQWRKGYAPGYAPYTPPIPAAPTTTSTIPPAPVVTSPQFPVRRSFTSITPTPTTRP